MSPSNQSSYKGLTEARKRAIDEAMERDLKNKPKN